MAQRNVELFAVTVYMLDGRLNVNRQIRESYRTREDFKVSEVAVAGRQGMLLKGSVSKERTNWSAPLGEWIDDHELAAIGQSTGAALLLLPAMEASKKTWALSFGWDCTHWNSLGSLPGWAGKLLFDRQILTILSRSHIRAWTSAL